MKREPILIDQREPTTAELLLAWFFQVPVERVNLQRPASLRDVTLGLCAIIPGCFALGYMACYWGWL